MATLKWFVRTGDQELGPLGPNGLRKLVRRGEVTRHTLVRREDHDRPVRAERLRGLFDADDDLEAPLRGPDLRGDAELPGPFTSLRRRGGLAAAALAAWVVFGALGLATALDQRAVALRIAAGEPLPLSAAGAPFLGLGSLLAPLLLVATAASFVWWLWCARMNLPHLIRARVIYQPSWAIAGWLMPLLQFVRPYQVIAEVDGLSAEAEADGDATVHARHLLLLPWWLAALTAAVLSLFYWLEGGASADQIATAAVLHALASGAVAIAAAFACAITLRITRLQERAHAAHPQPVRVHRDFRHNRRTGSVAGA